MSEPWGRVALAAAAEALLARASSSFWYYIYRVCPIYRVNPKPCSITCIEFTICPKPSLPFGRPAPRISPVLAHHPVCFVCGTPSQTQLKKAKSEVSALKDDAQNTHASAKSAKGEAAKLKVGRSQREG